MSLHESVRRIRVEPLTGFVCEECRSQLAQDGVASIADEIEPILNRSWLGSREDASSLAAVSAKLGLDLFATSAIENYRWWTRIREVVTDKGVEQLVKLLFVIVLAALAFKFPLLRGE
jgi:hypothetical protein